MCFSSRISMCSFSIVFTSQLISPICSHDMFIFSFKLFNLFIMVVLKFVVSVFGLFLFTDLSPTHVFLTFTCILICLVIFYGVRGTVDATLLNVQILLFSFTEW